MDVLSGGGVVLGVAVSRAQVALDALLELGGGEQTGAAAVLAELFRARPEVLTEALALAVEQEVAEGRPGGVGAVEQGTQIAAAWRPSRYGVGFVRFDLLRDQVLGEVRQVRAGWRAYVHYDHCDHADEAVDRGVHPTLEEAQSVVDAALRSEGGGGWVLR